MLRTLIAGALGFHGVIHLIGFVVPFRIARLEGFAYTTSAAWGRIELCDGGVGWATGRFASSGTASLDVRSLPGPGTIRSSCGGSRHEIGDHSGPLST